MTYQTLKTNIERELIFTLVLGLRRNRISEPRAKVISKAFLDVLKSSKGNEDLIKRISNICPMYPEILDAFIKTAKEFEDENIQSNLEIVRKELKGGSN